MLKTNLLRVSLMNDNATDELERSIIDLHRVRDSANSQGKMLEISLHSFKKLMREINEELELRK